MERSAATEAISPVLTIETHAPEETTALGARLGAGLRAGDVILLRGDLGAGKTHLARGVAAGLGIPGPIPSPTFTLVYEYDGVNAAGQRVPLAHIDLYRLSEGGDLDSMGLEDYVSGSWAAVIEWPERAVNEDYIPPAYLDIALDYADERTRNVTVTGHGTASRLVALLAARGGGG